MGVLKRPWLASTVVAACAGAAVAIGAAVVLDLSQRAAIAVYGFWWMALLTGWEYSREADDSSSGTAVRRLRPRFDLPPFAA